MKIGLPKGNVIDKSFLVAKKLLSHELDLGRLSFLNDTYEIYLLKHRDIPKLVEDGRIDIGITSYEWVKERQSDVKVLAELDWCDTKICLIKSPNVLKNTETLNCVTEFPNIAKEYLKRKNTIFSIYHISGSSEALVPGMFQTCIDCVESGETLRKNNLIVEEVILESRVIVIGNRDSINSKKERISEIVDVIKKIG